MMVLTQAADPLNDQGTRVVVQFHRPSFVTELSCSGASNRSVIFPGQTPTPINI